MTLFALIFRAGTLAAFFVTGNASAVVGIHPIRHKLLEFLRGMAVGAVPLKGGNINGCTAFPEFAVVLKVVSHVVAGNAIGGIGHVGNVGCAERLVEYDTVTFPARCVCTRVVAFRARGVVITNMLSVGEYDISTGIFKKDSDRLLGGGRLVQVSPPGYQTEDDGKNGNTEITPWHKKILVWHHTCRNAVLNRALISASCCINMKKWCRVLVGSPTRQGL